MTDIAAGNTWQGDIVQMKQANATVRSANRALARDDVATLSVLGFQQAHIRELRRKGGFRSSFAAQNTRTIICLRKREAARAD